MKASLPALIGSATALLAAGLVACSTTTGSSPVSAGRIQPASTPSVAGSQHLDTRVDGSVWVADEGGDSISVLDARSARLITTLTGIAGPHNVQAGSGGGTVYAVSGQDGMVMAIDGVGYRLTAAAATGREPAHVIEVKDKVYVTSAGQGSVDVFRRTGLSRITTVPLGGMPHGLRASRDGSVVAVANMGNKAVDLIDTRTDQRTDSIPVGGSPVQVAVDATGRYIYASVSTPASVVKIDALTRKVVATTEVPSSPVQVYLTEDGATLVSADQGDESAPGRTVSIISTRDMRVVHSVQVGRGPHGVALDQAARTAWITNTYDDTVSVIDLSRATLIGTVAVGRRPNGISFSPRPPSPAGSTSIPLNMPGGAPGTRPGGHEGMHMSHG